MQTNLISIHAPARGATKFGRRNGECGRNFNSRPCERGDRRADGADQRKCLYFNSRPCERGDATWIGGFEFPVPISIHAPARGATLRVLLPTDRTIFQFTPLREGRLVGVLGVPGHGGISIHAPARGATCRSSHPGWRPPNFNSRPCERGDLYGIPILPKAKISIHAPARGATGH